MRQPLDQAIRDAAANDLETSFFLEAGAGTGKTSILVDRVLEIVRSGSAQISEVVVITFTEKAAGELRGRIRAELHRKADATNDVSVRARFLSALRTLDAAHIETIHAFASSILRERPLEAGVDPNFRQLDEVGDELDFEERWRDWIWSVGGDELKAVERCLLLDLPLEEIRRVARWLGENRDVDARAIVPSAPDPVITLRRLLAICDSVGEDAAQCLNPDDWCFKRYSWAAEALHQLSDCRASALEPELNRVAIKVWGGNLRNWPDRGVRQRVQDALQEMVEVLTEFQVAARTNALASLVNALTEFVTEATQKRIAESKLNFEDLLIEARRVITQNAEVRRYLQRRYRFLLVDEFQDTDPIQAEMVFLLAAHEDNGSGTTPAWTDVTLEPGKLFLVGDPKQSIYRFRRADIAAFMKAREIFERHQGEGRPARTESISQNFRSVPEIVGWLNDLFSGVIERDPGLPFAQPEYEAIEAFRESADEPRVIHVYPENDLGGWKIDEVRKEEARTIARFIDELVDSSDWQLRATDADRSGDSTRHLSFRDICILVANRTKIDIYTDALEERRIPYVLDGGREFFQRQEVKDIAAILRAMDDPSDSVSLVAALKSEAFACSDVELLQYKLNGGRFHIFAELVRGDPVSKAIGRLRGLYDEKAHHSMPAFVDRVVRESFLVEAKLLDQNGRQRAANLRLIVQRAVDFAATEVDSLRPFIRWISERQRAGGQETESQVSESGDDVVRIMTVHSAKGLEFPLVILAKLAAGQAPSRDLRVVDRESSTLELQVGDRDNRFPTPGFEAAWQTERVYEEAEEKRLLYVAATRARDYLIVPVYKPEESPGQHVYLGAIPSWDIALGDPTGSAFAGARVLLDKDIPDRRRTPDDANSLPADLAKRWQERMERVRMQAAAGPRYVVPSRLSDDEIKEPRESEPKDRSEDESDADFQTDTEQSLGFAAGAAGNLFVGSSGARKRGSLVHEVLYRCNFSDPDSAVGWARRICRGKGAPDLIAEVTRHVRSILESDFMKQRVTKSNNQLRELPVATFDGQVYLEGFVDLAFEEDDGWVIVDYKTDTLRGGDPESLLERYRPQIDAYANALAASGMKVNEAGIWLSDSGEWLTTAALPNGDRDSDV